MFSIFYTLAHYQKSKTKQHNLKNKADIVKGEVMICKTSTNFEFSKNYQRKKFTIGVEELRLKFKKIVNWNSSMSFRIFPTCDIEKIDFIAFLKYIRCLNGH